MQKMQTCINTCQQCYSTCLNMAVTECLQKQGDHTQPDHFALMLECAEICRVAAHFMTMESRYHPAICKLCAEICTACAQSCERLDDMDECVQMCRKCAQECQSMAA